MIKVHSSSSHMYASWSSNKSMLCKFLCMSWAKKNMLYIQSCVWVDHIVMFLTEADVCRDFMLNESMFAVSACHVWWSTDRSADVKKLFERFLLQWQNKRHSEFLYCQYQHHFSRCTLKALSNLECCPSFVQSSVWQNCTKIWTPEYCSDWRIICAVRHLGYNYYACYIAIMIACYIFCLQCCWFSIIWKSIILCKLVFIILCKLEHKWFERGVKEAIHIRALNPSLNRDGERYNLPPIWNNIIKERLTENGAGTTNGGGGRPEEFC